VVAGSLAQLKALQQGQSCPSFPPASAGPRARVSTARPSCLRLGMAPGSNAPPAAARQSEAAVIGPQPMRASQRRATAVAACVDPRTTTKTAGSPLQADAVVFAAHRATCPVAPVRSAVGRVSLMAPQPPATPKPDGGARSSTYHHRNRIRTTSGWPSAGQKRRRSSSQGSRRRRPHFWPRLSNRS